MTKRIETRIPGFDDLLGGGFPDKSLVMLTGEVGSHHNTFAHQILYSNVQGGGKVAYYLLETPVSDVYDDLSVHSWSIEQFVQDGSWVFINVQTPELETLAEVAAGGSTGLSVQIIQSLNPLKKDLLARIKEGRWTALGLSYLLHHYDLKGIMDLIMYWLRATRAYGGLHLLLVDQGVHEERVTNALKHLSDGVLEFSLRERGSGPFEGVITVRKLRKTPHRPRSITYGLLDTGIVVETLERII